MAPHQFDSVFTIQVQLQPIKGWWSMGATLTGNDWLIKYKECAMKRSVLNIILCVTGLSLTPCDLEAQGWGRFSKDSIRLKRTVPAQASLEGRKVKLESQVTGNTPQSLLGVIETRFVTEL